MFPLLATTSPESGRTVLIVSFLLLVTVIGTDVLNQPSVPTTGLWIGESFEPRRRERDVHCLVGLLARDQRRIRE